MRQDIKEAKGLADDVIEVVVGEEEKPLYIHRGLLSSSSDFFKNALKGPFREAHEKKVALPEQKPEIFVIYIEWLYGQKLYSRKENDAYSETGSREWPRLLKLFILGDAIQDKRFCNVVIDGLIHKTKTEQKYPTSLAKDACAQLPSKSPLRRLLIDYWAWVTNDEWFENDGDPKDAPQEFWVEVARRTMQAAKDRLGPQSSYPWVVDRCQYHEHAEGEARCEQGNT